GLDRLRDILGRMGKTVGAAGLLSVLASITAEAAPTELALRVSQVIATSAPPPVASSGHETVAGTSAWKSWVIAGGIAIGGIATWLIADSAQGSPTAVVSEAVSEAVSAARSQHHVSPLAGVDGDGSAERPWSLETVLTHPSGVRPGDTIWLDGGHYDHGILTSALTGSDRAPITLRARPGAAVTISAQHVRITGSWTRYQGFELCGKIRDRVDAAGLLPGIELIGSKNACVNLVIHDFGDTGVVVRPEAAGSEISGCVVYHNGSITTDPQQRAVPHGFGIQLGNASELPLVVSDCIVFGNLAGGVRIEPRSPLAHQGTIRCERLVAFDDSAGDVMVGPTPVPELSITDSHLERIDLQLVSRSGIVLQGNHLRSRRRARDPEAVTSPLVMEDWNGMRFSGNAVYADGPLALLANPDKHFDPAICSWDDNTYHWSNDFARSPWPDERQPFLLREQGAPTIGTFDQWRTRTGFDTRSRFIAGRPQGQRTFVLANRHEPGRAHIVIYDWDRQGAVDIDLSTAGLTHGQGFELRDAEDLFAAPVVRGTYAGRSVRVEISRLTTVSTLLGTGDPGNEPLIQRAHADGEFSVLVLLPMAMQPASTVQPDR
nr:right-handed parallel beta-helix repeat-containing protein [Planctomycetota bacterium]